MPKGECTSKLWKDSDYRSMQICVHRKRRVPKFIKFCECGCGKTILGFTHGRYRSIEHGHNNKGRLAWNKGVSRSLETIEKARSTLFCNGSNKKIGFKGKHTQEAKEKIRQSSIERMKNVQYKENLFKKWFISVKYKPTKLEMKFDTLLKIKFPGEWRYVGDGQIWIGGKNPDFINVNGKKAVIEVFGSYFHKKEDEVNRSEHFRKFGFKTFIVWDYELKSPETLLTRLERGEIN